MTSDSWQSQWEKSILTVCVRSMGWPTKAIVVLLCWMLLGGILGPRVPLSSGLCLLSLLTPSKTSHIYVQCMQTHRHAHWGHSSVHDLYPTYAFKSKTELLGATAAQARRGYYSMDLLQVHINTTSRNRYGRDVYSYIQTELWLLFRPSINHSKIKTMK